MRKGKKAVAYFKRLYQLPNMCSAASVAFEVAKHKGETLPNGREHQFYVEYCLSHAPAKYRDKKKRSGKKQKKQAKGRSALGFKNIPRQTAKWIERDQYEKFYQSREWRELRYLALRNTEGRCECCGASAKDGAQLHVDHIKPRASRPDLQLSLDNIQVLCADCNIGKGAWDDTDWRHMDEITRIDQDLYRLSKERDGVCEAEASESVKRELARLLRKTKEGEPE